MAKKSSSKTNAKRVAKAVKKYDTDKSVKENSGAIADIVTATATSARRSKNSKQKKFYTVLCVLLVIAIIALLVFGYYHGWFDSFLKPRPVQPTLVSGDLSIHFLELGNTYTGDCVYIKAGNTDVLIDAGSRNNSASAINNYLDQYVTDNTLEYVIATHAHEDHLGAFYSQSGREGVFEHFKTKTIIEFALHNKTSVSDTSVLGRYINARDAEVADGAVCYTAAQCFDETDGAKKVYQLSEGISLEILYNYYYFNKQSAGENDYSVCCLIRQGKNCYMFTGDLEAVGEKKMVDYYNENNNPLPECVLYKAGHHGSKTSSSKELMRAIKPQYVCVCCCCGTSEYTDTDANQFPTQAFVNNVAPYTDNVYVTTIVDNYVSKSQWSKNGTVKPMNGNIVFSCDDGEISVKCSNNNTKLKDTDWFKQHRICPDEWKSNDEQ